MSAGMPTAQNGASEGTDNGLGTVRLVPVTRRVGLPSEQFYSYWGDVHGPLCSSIGHLAIYTQYHFKAQHPDYWRSAPDVTTLAGQDELVDGVAECGFATLDDFEAWLGGAGVLMEDEQNAFDGTYGYYSVGGKSHTAKGDDKLGAAGLLTVVVLLRRRDGVPVEAFESAVRDEIVPVLAASGEVQRVRYHLLEPYESHETDWRVTLVKHEVPPARRYHGAVELVVRDRIALRRLFADEAFQATYPAQAAVLAAAHPYPVRSVMQLVRGGARTLAGRRGPTIAALIREIGAIDALQFDDADANY